MKRETRRRLAYGSNATLVTAMVVGVLVLAYVLVDTYRAQWDLSAETANTLQPDTLAKLRLIDEEGVPVEITAFTAQRGKEESYFKDRSMKDLLRLMGEAGRLLDWRQVDFDRERLTAESLGVNDYGRVVIQRGEDRVDIKDRELFRRVGKGAARSVEFIGEDAISRGLSQLLTPHRRVVYVTTGHGELDTEDRGPEGLSDLVAALDIERFDVEALDLLRTDREGRMPDVPDDAAVVFVARPRTAFTPDELDILLSYIGRGGPVLIAVDVGTPVLDLVGRMGLSVPEGVALDKMYLAPHRDRPVPYYKGHPITRELQEAKLATVFAHSAGIRIADPQPDGVRATPVVTTGRDGWIDRGGAIVEGDPVFDEALDIEGPVNLAVSVELVPGRGLVRASKVRGRVLVVADGELFSNSLVGEGPGNEVFAVNAIHWLAGEDKRLKVGGGRTTRIRRLAITQEQTATLRWMSLGVMPLVVLAFGIATWAARRGR